jgi:hypothetical protein
MLASFDVGTKHLAICVLDGRCIKLWKVLDIAKTGSGTCCVDGCVATAKYICSNLSYCKRCAKKEHTFNSLQPHTRGKLRSKKLSELKELLQSHGITEPRRKQECLEECQKLLDEKKFLPVVQHSAKQRSLVEIGIEMKLQLDACFDDPALGGELITKVVIENQVGPLASTMKAVQGMLTQYFIMKDINNISYVSASNKLKPYTTEKLTYKQRKKLAITVTETLLTSEGTVELRDLYRRSKKKDDLADSYLQGLWIVESLK